MTLPPVAVTPSSAFAIFASTTLEISLCAIATAIENDTATTPTVTARDAAPVIASIVGESVASSVTLRPLMPRLSVPSPSMYALTSMLILFSAAAPARLRPTPTTPPASAADAARTIAWMLSVPVASNEMSPVATMLERSL